MAQNDSSACEGLSLNLACLLYNHARFIHTNACYVHLTGELMRCVRFDGEDGGLHPGRRILFRLTFAEG